MANLAKLELVALDITGKNYMSWIIDLEMHFDSISLTETIKDNNTTTIQNKAKAMIFLLKHLDEGLKYKYFNVKDPKVLWKDLQDRFDHQIDVAVPAIRNEWNNLRFQDYVKVNEYNSVMFKIVSQLRFCGEKITNIEMLEKTYTTFYKFHITLQQQYRLRRYQKYSALISTFLVAEKNNKQLIKNHQSCPADAKAFPKPNVVITETRRRENYGNHGCCRSYRRVRCGFNYTMNNNISKKHHTRYHGKRNDTRDHTSRNPENSYYRCETKGHWSRVCRTLEHLCKLYKESISE